MTDFNIPKEDNTLFLSPPANKIEESILKNRKLIDDWSFQIGSTSGRNFRANVKKRSLDLAYQYTSDLVAKKKKAFPPHFAPGDDPLIIQTGHQPDFYHPGVLVKYILLDSLVKKLKCVGLNTIVDSDICDSFSLDLSNNDNGEQNSAISFRPLEKPVPYETIDSPDEEELKSFFKSIENILTPSIYKKIRENFKEWQRALKKYPLENGSDISSFFTASKRSFLGEGNCSFYEIPLSQLSQTEEFLSFFLHLVNHRKKFAQIYNSRLCEYRKAHKLRYNANPFPDLLITEDSVELPFWFLEGDKRGDLKVKEISGEEILFSGNTELLRLSAKNSKDPLLSIYTLKNIRPKAIPQTIFYRMFLSDIFIHGIGGAKYDTITDSIIKDFFNVTPPDYITVTMTKYPEIEVENYQDKIEELENILRDIKYNPDRYSQEDGALYVIRKRELLGEIKKDGADKKKIGKEISDINAKLHELLLVYTQSVKDELLRIKQKQELYHTVMRRDLPYFFFSQKELSKFIYDKILRIG
jgi:hypothetical protein